MHAHMHKRLDVPANTNKKYDNACRILSVSRDAQDGTCGEINARHARVMIWNTCNITTTI